MKPITERHVQAIWYDEALRPSDWELHRHGTDPNYRNVVAHVTWGCGPVPGSLPPGALSIWLGRFVTSNTAFAPEQIDLMAYPYARLPSGVRPCEEMIGHNPDLARQILAAAARTMLLTAGGFEEWNRTGYRPHNTPEQRLANAAEIFTSTPTMKMSESADFSSSACRTIVKEMCGEGYLGKGRAAAVLANVIVPFALAEERVSFIPDWLPPEDLSEPVRLTAFRMFGRDHNPAAFYSTNGLLIQGLLQIHRDCCLQAHPDCAECELLKRKS